MSCWTQCEFKTAYDPVPLYWNKRHQFLLNDVFLNLGPNSNPDPLQIEAVSRFLFRHPWRSTLHLKLAWITQGGEDYMILLGSNLPNSCISSMSLFSHLELACLCDPWIKSRLTTAVSYVFPRSATNVENLILNWTCKIQNDNNCIYV